MAGPGGTINLSDGDDHFPGVGDDNSGDEIINTLNGSDSVFGGEGNDQINGAAGDDDLLGDAGDDFIQGGAGTDRLQGGDGNDIIWDFEGAFCFIDCGAGNDNVQIGTSFGQGSVINGGTGFDNLQIGATFSLALINIAGFENMDTFGGLVTARASQFDSFDNIQSSSEAPGGFVRLGLFGIKTLGVVTLDLSDELGGQFGRAVRLTASFNNENLTTGFLNDSVNAGTGNDVVNTGGGNDTLFGGAGADTLFGGIGNDKLYGGAGRDVMNGGNGKDSFHFLTIADSAATAANRDVINGFLHLTDKLNLAAIDAVPGGANDAFDFIGTAAFTAIGQVRAVQSGVNTLIALNTVGTGGAESVILLSNVTASTLTDADFVL